MILWGKLVRAQPFRYVAVVKNFFRSPEDSLDLFIDGIYFEFNRLSVRVHQAQVCQVKSVWQIKRKHNANIKKALIHFFAAQVYPKADSLPRDPQRQDDFGIQIDQLPSSGFLDFLLCCLDWVFCGGGALGGNLLRQFQNWHRRGHFAQDFLNHLIVGRSKILRTGHKNLQVEME